VKKNLEEEAKAILNIIDPSTMEAQLAAIKAGMQKETEKTSLKVFFSGRFSFPIMLAILFAVFNQFSGINAIIYYGPRIFEATGLAGEGSLLSQSLLGLFNLGFTMLGIFLIDKYGRKILMYIGSVGLILMLGLVALAFFQAPVDLSKVGNVSEFMAGLSAAEQLNITSAYSNVLYFLCMYIAFFAMSQGAVIWVFISEIFPNQVREYGQSLGSLTHWVLAAVITNVFPFFLGKFGGGPIFAFFAVMMIFQLLFVWFLMPETKGRTLEELGENLSH
jgi:MFS family permease